LTEPTTDSQSLLLQLLDPSNRANPYPAYAQIRERGPLQLPEMTLNVFSSFQDCDDVLRHPASASDRIKSTAVVGGGDLAISARKRQDRLAAISSKAAMVGNSLVASWGSGQLDSLAATRLAARLT
jgi:cytochrome P450